MSQKRNKTDGFPAGTADRLVILGIWIASKEVCTVSWRSSEGGVYQRTTILREVFQKDDGWVLAIESGPLLPVTQLLGVSPGTLPDPHRLEHQSGKP